MMNNHHKSNCRYAEEIAAYIYDEIGEREKTVFEQHLANCRTCATEVAEFSSLSFSIGAWRENEFAHLATPQIEIPYEKRKNVEIASGSHLAGFRQMFSRFSAWTTAGAAMAALLICVGLIFMAIRFSNNADVAEFNKNSVKPAISPTAEVRNEQPKEEIADNAPKTSNDPNVDLPNNSASKNTVKSPNSIVKISDAPKNKNVRQNNVKIAPNKPNESKRIGVKPTQKRQSPSLNAFDEDEDDSLRLADLFAEIDTEK